MDGPDRYQSEREQQGFLHALILPCPTQTPNSGRAEQWIAGCGWVALFPSLNWLSIRHHLIEHCVHWTEFCKWTRYLKYSYSNSYIDPTEANPIGKKYGA